MRLSNRYSIVMGLLTAFFLASCTHKTLITGEDGFKYYEVRRNNRIGVKDLDGNVIVPIKMKEIYYNYRFNKQSDKERWFLCWCYDNKYVEVYNANNSQCIIGDDLGFVEANKLYLNKDEIKGGEATSTYFFVRRDEDTRNIGLYDFSGKEIIPLRHESIQCVLYSNNLEKKRNASSNASRKLLTVKYADHSDLFYCRRDFSALSVYDANGRCIIPKEYGYKTIYKVNVPTRTPLLECWKTGSKECDYRYSTSGELFLSGHITVKVINEQKDLYYLKVGNNIYDNHSDYYDIYGDIIIKGQYLEKWDSNTIYYDEERGFYFEYYDSNYDLRTKYINKKIDKSGHVIPIHTYSSSFGEWDNYGSSDIWVGSDMDGGYEWNDYSSPQNSSTTPQTGTHKCGLCGGSGRVINNDGISFGNTKYCDECGKTVPDSHYHTICPSCKGKGWW